MSDELREKIEALPILNDVFKWKRTPGTTPDWTKRDIADAVLAVLPSEGWEQVGWTPKKDAVWIDDIGPISGNPRHYTTDLDPVYRRVDGAAPPFSPFNPEGITMDESGNLTYLDGAAPPEPEQCPNCRGTDRSHRPMLDPGWDGPLAPCDDDWHAPASSTPTEVERLREALTAIRNHANDGTDDAHLRLVWIVEDADAALSGQQDTTEAPK